MSHRWWEVFLGPNGLLYWLGMAAGVAFLCYAIHFLGTFYIDTINALTKE